MGRPKKIQYEYVDALKLYRKRIMGPAGKYVAIYGKTPKELESAIAVFETQKELSALGKENIPCCEYIEKWMDNYEPRLRYGSAYAYRSAIKCNILPVLAEKRMLEIRPKDIEQLMRTVENKSESIYKTTYSILKMVFTYAYENHDILSNPCTTTHKGGVAPKERVPLTDEQVKTLLSATKDTKAYPFCMIALYAGLRREEILGLQWDCVFLSETPRIEVRRAHRIIHNRPVVASELKSKAARRVIPIPPQLVACLKELKKSSQSDFVICNSKSEPLSGSQYKALWKSVVARSTREHTYYKYMDGVKKQYKVQGVKGERVKGHSFTYDIDFYVSPHVLRHTYITNLLLGGVDIKTVQYLAGHEKSTITLDIYAHLMYHKPEDMIDQIDTIFEGVPF